MFFALALPTTFASAPSDATAVTGSRSDQHAAGDVENFRRVGGAAGEA
jgi:hypothetical protein